jgi:hypothetical protein
MQLMILASVCETTTPILPALIFVALAITSHLGVSVAIRRQWIEIAHRRQFAVGQVLLYGAAVLSWLITGLRLTACGQ